MKKISIILCLAIVLSFMMSAYSNAAKLTKDELRADSLYELAKKLASSNQIYGLRDSFGNGRYSGWVEANHLMAVGDILYITGNISTNVTTASSLVEVINYNNGVGVRAINTGSGTISLNWGKGANELNLIIVSEDEYLKILENCVSESDKIEVEIKQGTIYADTGSMLIFKNVESIGVNEGSIRYFLNESTGIAKVFILDSYAESIIRVNYKDGTSGIIRNESLVGNRSHKQQEGTAEGNKDKIDTSSNPLNDPDFEVSYDGPDISNPSVTAYNNKTSISKATVTFKKGDNGSYAPIVNLNGKELKVGTDYSYIMTSSAINGRYVLSFSISGVGDYKDSIQKGLNLSEIFGNLRSGRTAIANATVTTIRDTNGALMPVVKLGDKTLNIWADYRYSMQANSFVIFGMGNYGGQVRAIIAVPDNSNSTTTSNSNNTNTNTTNPNTSTKKTFANIDISILKNEKAGYDVTVKDGSTLLKVGKDYDEGISVRTDGSVTVDIYGKGDYEGQKYTKVYKANEIKTASNSNNSNTVTQPTTQTNQNTTPDKVTEVILPPVIVSEEPAMQETTQNEIPVQQEIKEEKFMIQTEASIGGKISPENPEIKKGESVRFTFEAYNGFSISDVLIDGKSIGKRNSYSFSNITQSHTLGVIFVADTIEEIKDNNTDWRNPFIDVKEKDWYYDSVKFVNQKQLFNGISSTEFNPNGYMTRGMLVTVLYRFEGANEKSKATFEDVSESSYYTHAIAWATKKGIVKGIGDNKFDPDAQLTRQDLATIIARYINMKNIKIRDSIARVPEFTDNREIANYAKESVELMAQKGLMSGKSGNAFKPRDYGTRAEVATIFQRLFDNM